MTVACCKSVMTTLEEPIRGVTQPTYWGTAFNGPINGISWINPTRKQRLRLSVMASNNRCYRKFLYSQMVCVMLWIGKIGPLSSDSVLGVVFVQFVLPSHRFDGFRIESLPLIMRGKGDFPKLWSQITRCAWRPAATWYNDRAMPQQLIYLEHAFPLLAA